jgi:hypothetical protein
MIILADYNINRQALLLSGSLAVSGFLDLIPIRITTFAEVGLAENSSDRIVWRFIQDNKLLLLTANRNAQGEDSLEQVMRQENQPTSLPILTIGDPDRINEFEYRERSLEKLVEIVIDIQDYLGAGRLFIP